ncbi:alpha/beta hydrolase [Marichromatium sp. PS1]|uniref:alpha/beta hydrolase n=1 Tax=Marichromatium sp. PS1 TaxID=3138932 RepID=UPI0034E8B82A
MSMPSLARCRGRCLLRLLVAVIALVAILGSLWRLHAASAGVEISTQRIDGVPLTLYRPAGVERAPAVVIAHGFAGSQRMMQPYALTLARNGYVAVTFDFAGHGRNPAPFVASLEDQQRRLAILTAGLTPAVALALEHADPSGRVALLGHSMAGDVLARHAAAHPETVVASVLLSPYLSPETEVAPIRNLLLVYGALEPEMLHAQGLERLAAVLDTEVAPGEVYGAPETGDGRGLMLVEGAEHIGVLYAEGGQRLALDWLDRSFGHVSQGGVDRRGGALALLFLGLVALAWPLAALLPRAAATPRGAGLGWRRLWPVAVAPAILTPLLLWPLPTGWLPILLGDYLSLHFGLYGLLTLAGLWWVRRRGGCGETPALPPVDWSRLALATLAVMLYFGVALTLPVDRFVTTLVPDAHRLPLVLAILCGTALYFAADEWVTRGQGAGRGAYAATKLLFLLSLALAVALNLAELFFLVIIIPAILVFFLVYGLLSGWVYRRVNHPLAGALANALAFASAVAVTFPVVG